MTIALFYLPFFSKKSDECHLCLVVRRGSDGVITLFDLTFWFTTYNKYLHLLTNFHY